jgi:hypothetical protein
LQKKIIAKVPHDDHCPLAHALDKREAKPERSQGRSGVVDDHGLPPPRKLKEVRERDPYDRIAVQRRTVATLGNVLLRSGTTSRRSMTRMIFKPT